MMKVEWSDKSINDLEKTYSEIYEFNKQLNNLFPSELTEANSIQLDFKEDQKEDFVKEIPQVTDFCSKIATLPKQVCESEFLKNFFLKKSRVKQSNKAANANHHKQSDDVVEPPVLKSASNQNEAATSNETIKENASLEKNNNSEQLLVETKKNNIHSKVNNTSTKQHQIAESSTSLTSTNDLINTTTNQNKNSNSSSQNSKKHSLANGNQNQVNITIKSIIS